MEYMEYVQYLFTAIIAAFVVFGFLIGFYRGSKRALLRLVWLVLTVAAVTIFTPKITPLFLNTDVSFLNLSYNGTTASNMKEYITLAVSGALNASPEELSGTIEYVLALVTMALNGVIFAILFFGAKYVTLVIYKVCAVIFIHDKGKSKGRFVGALIGCVSGALVALTVLVPVAGYVSVYDAVADSLGSEYQSSFEKADEVIDIYKEDTLVKLIRGIGIEKLQIDIFNAVSTAEYGDTTFRLSEEKYDILNAVPALIALGNEANSENPDFDSMVNSLATLLDSNIVYVGIKELSPVLGSLIETADFGSGTGAAELKSVLLDVIGNLPKLEKNKIKRGLNSMATVLSGLKDLDDPDAAALEKVGKGLDDLIESGLVTNNKIADLAATAAESLFESVTDEDDIYDTTQEIINGLKAGVNSYKTEFGAAGCLLEATDVLNEEFSFDKDAAKLGAKIDDALKYKAQIIDKELVDSFVEKTIESYSDDLLEGDFAKYVDEITDNLSHDISYETEFGYVAKLFELSNFDYSIDKITQKDESGVSLGVRLDEISSSVLVGKIPMLVIQDALDVYAADNEKYEAILNEIKNNFTTVANNSVPYGDQSGYTYSNITEALGDIYAKLSTAGVQITEKTEFTADIASNYETTLNELTLNILMGQNATRALASHIAGEVKTNIDNIGKKYPLVDLSSVTSKIDVYISYLSRTKNLGEEPYASNLDTFKTADGSNCNETTEGSTRVNKPFTYFCELLTNLLPKSGT